MFVGRNRIPLDYSLCTQTVTVYRREGLKQEVWEGVYYEYRRSETVQTGRTDGSVTFLLIAPGAVCLEPGDKVSPGVGPEIQSLADWACLSADSVPGLGIVRTVCPRYWQGNVCHVEVRG